MFSLIFSVHAHTGTYSVSADFSLGDRVSFMGLILYCQRPLLNCFNVGFLCIDKDSRNLADENTAIFLSQVEKDRITYGLLNTSQYSLLIINLAMPEMSNKMFFGPISASKTSFGAHCVVFTISLFRKKSKKSNCST